MKTRIVLETRPEMTYTSYRTTLSLQYGLNILPITKTTTTKIQPTHSIRNPHITNSKNAHMNIKILFKEKPNIVL